MELKPGIKGNSELIVSEAFTAEKMGSGTLPVFATPAMIALIEETAWKSVQEYLPKGSGTVGTKVEVSHVSATPLGMKVFCETELVEADGRRLRFQVSVWDEAGPIGEGVHERFVIEEGRFLEKAIKKRKEPEHD